MGNMANLIEQRDALLALTDVARLLKTFVDREAADHGMTHAQWGVLRRIERHDGSMQAEIAEQMELQPISLVPILDKLCEQGLIERRAHPEDRRAKLLFLTGLGKSRLQSLEPLAEGISNSVFAGVPAAGITGLRQQLLQLKDNIKRASDTTRTAAKGG